MKITFKRVKIGQKFTLKGVLYAKKKHCDSFVHNAVIIKTKTRTVIEPWQTVNI